MILFSLLIITISRRKSQGQIFINRDIQHLQQLQLTKSACQQNKERKEFGCMSTTLNQNNVISHDWIFGRCLNKQEQQSSVYIKDQVIQSSISLQANRNTSCNVHRSNSQQKLKVIGNKSRSHENSRIYPKSLNKIRQIKSQQLMNMKNQVMQQKCNQILRTKRGTDTHQSPSLSKNSSNKILLDASAKYTQQLDKSYNNKKLDLTLSKKLSTKGKNSQNQKTPIHQNMFLPLSQLKQNTYKSHTFLESQVVKGINDNRSHFHSSTNEFKIVDPLDELKSQNTQRLKKKLVFSWVRSDKEEDVIDKLQVPLLTVRQSNSEYLLNDKKPCQIHKSMAVMGNIDEKSLIKNSNMISGESLVQMKGADHIFELSSLSLQKQTKNKATLNLSDSIIEHTDLAEEQNQWYHIK